MKYLILILMPFISLSQSEVPDKYWLDDSNFEETISSGAFGDDNENTIVIEFWAKFNEANCFAEWDQLEEADYYRVDISKAPKINFDLFKKVKSEDHELFVVDY